MKRVAMAGILAFLLLPGCVQHAKTMSLTLVPEESYQYLVEHCRGGAWVVREETRASMGNVDALKHQQALYFCCPVTGKAPMCFKAGWEK